MKKTLALIFSFFMLSLTCFNCSKPCEAPERLNGIPLTAIWHGSCDGGYWFDIIEIQNGPIYRIKIYNDATGKMLWDNHYKIKEGCEEILNKVSNIQDVIEYQNDNKIYLTVNKDNIKCFLYPAY